MGILKGLVLLPLAPVRGVMWLGERIAEQADRQLDAERDPLHRLSELRTARELGEIDDAGYLAAEAALLDELGAGPDQDGDGGTT